MIRFDSGDLRLTILSAGTLWLDGGAMFGVVPKVLWAKLRPPDDRNRIRLGMNVLLVDDGRTRTLIDNGERKAALAVNEAVRVLGTEVDPTRLIPTIVRES